MTRVVLQFGPDHDSVSWVQRQADGWSEPREGDLAAAALAAGGQPVDVLVPAEDVLLTEVVIAARQRRRLLQALPFAVEEQLAGDVTDYHVALGMRLGEHRYLAGAVARSVMDRWMDTLREAGLEPRCMVPEVLALPLETGWGTLAVEGRRALLRVAPERGYAAARSEMPAFVELEEGLRQLILLDPGEDFEPPADLTCRRVPQRQPLLSLLAEGLADSPPVDLIQGDYAGGSERSRGALRLWKAAAVVAVLALVLAGTERWLAYRSVAEDVEALQEQSRAILKETFPEVERIVNPRAQLEQRMENLRAGSGGGRSSFIYLLQLAGPSVLRARELEIRGIAYRNGELLLDVHAPSLAVIEAVRQHMLGNGGLGVELESAATLADGADARLRVWRQAG